MEKPNHLVGHASPGDTPPQPVLDALTSKLISHAGSLRFVREHLNGVLARAFGETPAEGKASKPRPVRSGAVGSIDDSMDDIYELTGEITNLLARLETLA